MRLRPHGIHMLRVAVILVGACAALATSAAAIMATPGAPTPAGALPNPTFTGSGLIGGGIQNVVAVDPGSSGIVLAGGDVAGIHRSTDWGQTWQPVNGTVTIGGLAVAALQFSPSVPGKVYAALGQKGPGGVMVSTDYGATWSVRSTSVRFSGVNGPTIRPTGNLFAFDPAGQFLYAGTYDQGVRRSADDGRTWTSIGSTGGLDIRSIQLDPANPDVLYAATWQGAVYRTTKARGAGGFTALTGGPTAVEELASVGGKLWAASWSGVHVSSDGGATWTTSFNDGAMWLSIAGGVDSSGRVVLYAGSSNSASSSGNGYDNIIRTVDGGLTWQSLTGGSQVHTNVGGPLGSPWWLSYNQPGMMLGGQKAYENQLAVDPHNLDRVFAAGRLGVWSTADGGANWYPMVSGLGDTVARAVVADPHLPGRVYVSMADWVFAYSIDGLRSVVQSRPGGGASRTVALDTTGNPAAASPVYLGVGDDLTNTAGEVWSNTDPALGRPWVNEGLGAVAGGRRPVAITVQRVGGQPVILAAVDQGGVWRKQSGVWTKVSATAMSVSSLNRAASFSWATGSSTAFLYDPATGVWRSNDTGRTWTKIWAKPSNNDLTGYLAADPARSNELYVSVAFDGVYRLVGVKNGIVGSGITATKIGSFTSPGAMTFGADGGLYVADVGTGSPGLWRSKNQGGSWVSLDDAAYDAVAHYPTSIAVDATGGVFVALRGNGVLRRDPAPLGG
jgi:hypothetical protein